MNNVDAMSVVWHSGKSLGERCVNMEKVCIATIKAENLEEVFKVVGNGILPDIQKMTDETLEGMVDEGMNHLFINAGDRYESTIITILMCVEEYILRNTLQGMKSELLKDIFRGYEKPWK